MKMKMLVLKSDKIGFNKNQKTDKETTKRFVNFDLQRSTEINVRIKNPQKFKSF